MTAANFVPMPGLVGSYRKEHLGREFFNKGSYSPSKWVHHEQALEKVLEGDYDSIRPITAELIPSLDCNFRCPTCAYRKWKQDEDVWVSRTHHPELNADRSSMNKYVSMLAEGGVKGIIFTGGGETFINPSTIDVITDTSETETGIGIYTNGSLLDERIIHRIFSAVPTFFRVSLNAGTPESHSKIHGYHLDKGHFERILENIYLSAVENRRLKDILNSINKRGPYHTTEFGVSVIINPTNVGELEKIARILAAINEKTGGGVDYLNVRPTLDYHWGRQFDARIFERAVHTLETDVRGIVENAGMTLYNLTNKFDDVLKPRTYKVCRASSLFAEVSYNGDLFFCCEKLGYPDYRIGNLNENSIEEIWKSDRRKSVIEKVAAEGCRNCPPSCKPNQMNKIFDQIEDFRRLGKIDIVGDWIDDLKTLKMDEYSFL